MANDIVNMLPGRDCFGSMTQEQILELTRHPPAPDKDRGGPGADPLGRHTKASEITPEYLTILAQSNSKKKLIGVRIYHRKRREEGTIIAEVEAGRKVRVKRDNGSEYNANIENITRLD